MKIRNSDLERGREPKLGTVKSVTSFFRGCKWREGCGGTRCRTLITERNLSIVLVITMETTENVSTRFIIFVRWKGKFFGIVLIFSARFHRCPGSHTHTQRTCEMVVHGSGWCCVGGWLIAHLRSNGFIWTWTRNHPHVSANAAALGGGKISLDSHPRYLSAGKTKSSARWRYDHLRLFPRPRGGQDNLRSSGEKRREEMIFWTDKRQLLSLRTTRKSITGDGAPQKNNETPRNSAEERGHRDYSVRCSHRHGEETRKQRRSFIPSGPV